MAASPAPATATYNAHPRTSFIWRRVRRRVPGLRYPCKPALRPAFEAATPPTVAAFARVGDPCKARRARLALVWVGRLALSCHFSSAERRQALNDAGGFIGDASESLCHV